MKKLQITIIMIENFLLQISISKYLKKLESKTESKQVHFPLSSSNMTSHRKTRNLDSNQVLYSLS